MFLQKFVYSNFQIIVFYLHNFNIYGLHVRDEIVFHALTTIGINLTFIGSRVFVCFFVVVEPHVYGLMMVSK